MYACESFDRQVDSCQRLLVGRDMFRQERHADVVLLGRRVHHDVASAFDVRYHVIVVRQLLQQARLFQATSKDSKRVYVG